jgi:hypothetical protein
VPSIWELAIDDINAAHIEQLVTDGQAESIWLEFKRELNLKKESDKREAAKDVSAFANARGGLLIYGVDEKTLEDGREVAGALTPLSENDLKDRLTTTLYGRIEPRPEIRVRIVPATGSGWYLVVKIEASYYDLHAVDGRFYARTDAGAHQMSALEVRSRHEQLFQLKASGEQRALDIAKAEAISAPWLGIVVVPLSYATDVPVYKLSREDFAAPDLPKPIHSAYQFGPSSRGYEASIPDGGRPSYLLRLRRDGALHVGSERFFDNDRAAFWDREVLNYCLKAIRMARYIWGRLGIWGPAVVVAVVETDRELRAADDWERPGALAHQASPLTERVVLHYPRGLDDGAALAAEVLNRIAYCCGLQRSRFVDEDGKLKPKERWPRE